MFSIIGLLVPLFFIIVMVLIVRAIVQSFSSGSRQIRPGVLNPMPGSPANVITQIGDDGFWVESMAVGALSVIHYYYWANGARYLGQIPFQPGSNGRQFVYTGMRPEQVVIHQIINPINNSPLDMVPPITYGSDPVWSSTTNDTSGSVPSAPPSSSSFPAAY